MKTPDESAAHDTLRARVAVSALRALRSLALICVVGIVIVAIRRGGVQISELRVLATQSLPLMVVIFLLLLSRDLWFRKAKEAARRDKINRR